MSTITLNSNKLQSTLGAPDCDPEVSHHICLTNMVIIQRSLNSDPYYYLPFVVHAFPETGTRLLTVVSSRVSLIECEGYSPCVPRI